MTKAVWGSVFTAAAVLVCASPVAAQQQQDTKSVTLTAQVNPKAKLTVGSTTAAFGDADPDAFTTVSAPAISVGVKARTAANQDVTLTVQAGGDLATTGGDTIAIDQLSWTVTGALQGGTMASGVAKTLGSWTGGGTQSGTQTWVLVNSWSYRTGTYTAVITYTLTAP